MAYCDGHCLMINYILFNLFKKLLFLIREMQKLISEAWDVSPIPTPDVSNRVVNVKLLGRAADANVLHSKYDNGHFSSVELLQCLCYSIKVSLILKSQWLFTCKIFMSTVMNHWWDSFWIINVYISLQMTTVSNFSIFMCYLPMRMP